MEDDARHLAERHLATALPQRWRHVQAVAGQARHLCVAVGIDPHAVVAAAWLHDIGYGPAVSDTDFHPLDGARYLRAHGWDTEVCRLVAHHTDAAVHADAAGLGEQLRQEFPALDSPGQDVLWTADATTGPNGERLTVDERIDEIVDRYGPDHPVADRMRASRRALNDAIVRTTTAPARGRD